MGSFRAGWTNANIVDSAYEKTRHYKGEFTEYARPFDRYLDENRFKEIKEAKEEEAAKVAARDAFAKDSAQPGDAGTGKFWMNILANVVSILLNDCALVNLYL